MKIRFALIILSIVFFKCNALVKLVNIVCFSHNATLSDVSECTLKKINRNVNEFSILIILKKELTNLKAHFEMYRKTDVYRPWLFDITVDVCKFIKNPESNRFLKRIWKMFEEYSNFNHSCPYEGYVAYRGVRFDKRKHNLPLPIGEYRIQVAFSSWEISTTDLHIYIEIQ